MLTHEHAGALANNGGVPIDEGQHIVGEVSAQRPSALPAALKRVDEIRLAGLVDVEEPELEEV